MKTVIDRTQLADGQNREVEIVLHSDPKYRGSIENIQTHPFFEALAPVQRAFAIAYILDRDPLRAAYKAGTYSSDHSASMAGLRMLRDFRIRALVEEYDGEPPATSDKTMTDQELIWLISKRLRSGEISDAVFSSLAQQLVELKAWRKSKRGRPKAAAQEAGKPEPEESEEDGLSDPFEEVRRLEAARNNA